MLYVMVPGDLASLTGGYGYDRQIVAGLRQLGWAVSVLALDGSFPAPHDAALQHAADLMAQLPQGATVLVDGLAFGAMPELIEAHAHRLRWVALVHHPLAQETGLSESQKQRLSTSEQRALQWASRVIVTSPATARALQGDGVPPERIRVVMPGTDAAPLATGSVDSVGSARGKSLSLLCVATVTPRKGHAILIEALAELQDRAWALHCVGSLSRDDASVRALHSAIALYGLQGRVHLHGEVSPEHLAEHYAHADAFVLPSYHEGYGMALAEALAVGLPIISTATGAIPDTVPAAACELLPPGDVAAWRQALARLMDDDQWRHQLTLGAQTARLQLPSWQTASAQFAEALHGFV